MEDFYYIYAVNEEVFSISLSELLEGIREEISGSFPEKIWVRAEVASVQVKSNGHCYLELCESDGTGLGARVKAVIWRSRHYALAHYFEEETGSGLAPGMNILVRVQVNFSELYGLSLVVDELEPRFTIGETELTRRRTIARLEEEGLLDAQKSLSLPILPYRLAVISAPDAAGYGDFRKHLSDNEYGFVFDAVLFGATMQGGDAPASISAVLEEIEDSSEAYDAVLIIRGGGSVLDLSCFDDYDLCAAIASCSIPVFTAIGHERDCHAADLVAYAHTKTPTALADEFISAFAAEDERISAFSSRLKIAFNNRISAIESRLDVLQSRIHAADPNNILARGYTLVTDGRGIILKSAVELKSGDCLNILFPDGSVKATVQ